MNKVNWSNVIDWIGGGIMSASLLMLTISTLALLFFDSIVGMGSIYKLSGFTEGNTRWFVSLFGSFASTGLQTALAFVAYLLFKRRMGSAAKVFLGISLIFWGIDIYFDALTADILRYGKFISMSDLSGVEKNTHIMWRNLVAGFSAVGEFLAFSVVLGMDELKNFLKNTFPMALHTPNNYRQNAELSQEEKIAILNRSRRQNQPAKASVPKPPPFIPYDNYDDLYPEHDHHSRM